MKAFSHTSRVVTHAARQKRIFCARVRQPANEDRQDGPAASAGETSVVTAIRSARAIVDVTNVARMRRVPSTDNIGTRAREL
jgi:hypothetical protein